MGRMASDHDRLRNSPLRLVRIGQWWLCYYSHCI